MLVSDRRHEKKKKKLKARNTVIRRYFLATVGFLTAGLWRM